MALQTKTAIVLGREFLGVTPEDIEWVWSVSDSNFEQTRQRLRMVQQSNLGVNEEAVPPPPSLSKPPVSETDNTGHTGEFADTSAIKHEATADASHAALYVVPSPSVRLNPTSEPVSSISLVCTFEREKCQAFFVWIKVFRRVSPDLLFPI